MGVLRTAWVLIVLATGVAAALPPDLAAATPTPSFDCGRASTWSERTLCADAGLADLDRTMAARYRERRAAVAGADRARLIEEQRAWLRRREGCKTAAAPLACIEDLYRKRIDQLAGAATAGSAHGSASAPPAATAGGATGSASAPPPATADAARPGASPPEPPPPPSQQRVSAARAYAQLRSASVRDRLIYFASETGNPMAVLAAAEVLGSPIGVRWAIRVASVSGNAGEADWPVPLRFGHGGTISRPGWFLVSADVEGKAAAGGPQGTLRIRQATACRAEACAAAEDLIEIIRIRQGLPDWQPN